MKSDCPVPRTPLRSTASLPPPPATPFQTPRRRKTPASTPQRACLPVPPVSSTLWPRLRKVIPIDTIIDVTEELYGYEPHPWQLKVFEKVAEGRDAFVVAGTGYGKSLIFGLLAAAAAMAGHGGVVIVISPLKTLQKDQVRRFNEKRVLKDTGVDGTQHEYCISAVAVNEDNKDPSVFIQIGQGAYRLVYASPEILLHSSQFKQLFRDESFRKSVVAMVVDEAHIIEEWKDDFRKAYGELSMLRTLVGMEIPWVALTGTCSTKTFETVFTTLGMGGMRLFYGIDMGADRPNLKLLVRPMESSAASMADLFAIIPHEIDNRMAITKTLVYLKTRQQARRACQLCRLLVTTELRDSMYAITATSSEDFKDEVMRRFLNGNVRILFATMAVGMGTDVPDIEKVVIFSVDGFNSAYQKGGRAGRSSSIEAEMLWLVEPWALDSSVKKADTERRLTMDQDSREFIKRAQSLNCQRIFIRNHFRPQPDLPGFKWYDGEGDVGAASMVEWEVENEFDSLQVSCGSCSALVCRSDPTTPMGPLSDTEKELIASHVRTLQTTTLSFIESMEKASAIETATKLKCTEPERADLREALNSWRDSRWKEIRPDNPFLSRDWVISNGNINHLVRKAHVILNVLQVDAAVVRKLISWISTDELMISLITVLDQFRQAHWDREDQAAAERPSKWSHLDSSENPFVDETHYSTHSILQWQVQNYVHDHNPHPMTNPTEYQLPSFHQDPEVPR